MCNHMVYSSCAIIKAKTGGTVMPWEERTVKEMREEFVRRVQAKEKSKAELCREYHISRPTGDKWLQRYEAGETLENRSRAPHNQAGKTAPEVEQHIVKYRQQYPAIGAVKLHRMLKDEGYSPLPSPRTVNNILKRNGLITREASLAATPIQRFEKAEANEMWQADFKGHFAMGNGQRCHTLNINDDCTRFNLCCEALPGETFEVVKPVMERLFRENGLPFSFLCDNGNPWGTAQSVGFTKFEVWLMELGILTIHGRVLHPQTQGKEESFNRSFTRELLKTASIQDFPDAQRQFDEYRNFYNYKRPHHALELATPGSKYTRSIREYPEVIPEWEYPEGFELRNVKETGYLSWKGQGYFLSEAFGNKQIAVRESRKEGCISLYYRQFKIGRINIEKRAYEFRRIYLAEGDPRLTDKEETSRLSTSSPLDVDG